MPNTVNPRLNPRSLALEIALESALFVVSAEHKAFETLDLEDLQEMAWGKDSEKCDVNGSALNPLRDYLNGLPGFTRARADCVNVPLETQNEHIYAAMELLSSRSNAAVHIGEEQVIVLNSILPSSLDDDDESKPV